MRASILRAIQQGKKEFLQVLFNEGLVHINEDIDINGAGGSVLAHAARCGQKEVVALILDQDGVSIDLKNAFDGTALMEAAECGHRDVVALLLERGANPHVKDCFGRNVLQIALDAGHQEVGELLKSKGAVKSKGW